MLNPPGQHAGRAQGQAVRHAGAQRVQREPPASVPTTPVATVTAPNTKSAVSPLMPNTSRPALGPR